MIVLKIVLTIVYGIITIFTGWNCILELIHYIKNRKIMRFLDLEESNMFALLSVLGILTIFTIWN